MNPLLNLKFCKDYKIPFDKIKLSHFVPAAKYWAKISKQRIEQIKKEKNPTFENTIVALEKYGLELDQVMAIFSVYNTCMSSKEVDIIGSELAKISIDDTSWIYDKKLFSQIEKVYNLGEDLDSIQKKLLVDAYEGFKRSGVMCSPKQKARLKQISKDLAKLELRYGSKLIKEASYAIEAFEDEVGGIPEDTLRLGRELAKKHGEEGYLFTDNDFDAILTFAENRDLRKRLYIRYRKIGLIKHKTEDDIKEIIKLRNQEARIVGFKNHTESILKERMVKSEENLNKFYKKIIPPIRKKARKDLSLLKAEARKDGIKDFQRYDEYYYRNKLLNQKYSLDQSELQEYFPMDKVWEGTIKVFSKMFEISFHKIRYPVYHRDVKAYEVRGKEGKIGTLLLDLFYRPSKSAGAWMNDLVESGFGRLPTALIVMNQSKTKNKLMSLEDVRTLFHEMGHAMHVLLSKAYYPSQAGVNVAWDFVELPSQFMENFVDDESVLKEITSHYKTGRKLPKRYIDAMKKSSSYMSSLDIMNQIFQGKLDIELHNSNGRVPLQRLDNEIHRKFSIYEPIKGTSRITNFSHIIDGGYDVGYYSYLWADILNKDAFAVVSKTGGLKSAYMKRFRTLLESGSIKDEAELYRDFRGRDPELKAFLKRIGVSK